MVLTSKFLTSSWASNAVGVHLCLVLCKCSVWESINWQFVAIESMTILTFKFSWFFPLMLEDILTSSLPLLNPALKPRLCAMISSKTINKFLNSTHTLNLGIHEHRINKTNTVLFSYQITSFCYIYFYCYCFLNDVMP